MEKLDLQNLEASKSKHKSASAGKGVLSIISKKGSQNSLLIAEEVVERLGYPEMVAIYFDTDGIVLRKLNQEMQTNCFKLRTNEKKWIIYSKPLIEEIIETYNLDFENKTSLTVDTVEYVGLEDDDEIVAKIIILEE